MFVRSAQIVWAGALRHPTREIERVSRLAFIARGLADRLIDRLTLVLGVLRADDAGQAEARGEQKSATSGYVHCRAIIRCGFPV